MPRLILYPEPEASLRRKRQQKYDELADEEDTEQTYKETYKGKLQKYLIYKLSVDFSEIASYIIKRIMNDYTLLLITNIEEPHEDVFDIIENEQLRMRLRIFIDNGSLINNIKDKLPISTRQRFNVTVSENILQVTEKLSSLGTDLLQAIQANIAAVESTISSTRVLVNSIEIAVAASRSHYEDEDSKLLLTTSIRNMSFCVLQELSQSIDNSSTNILATMQITLTQARDNVAERMLQIFQDLSDSVKLHHQIFSGVESNTRTRPIRLQKLFSLFPTSGLQWRFIKIDGNNLNSFTPQGNTAATDYDSTLTNFYEAFDFRKLPNLKIRSVQDLCSLPNTMNKIFIDEVKTDRYTCQFTFVRRRKENPMINAGMKLELQDFTQEEIDLYFRPCTIDPGKSQVFTSYHGNGQIRRTSTKEYYSFGGTLSRMGSQDRIKIRTGIKTVENNIPSPKTINMTKYQDHVVYLLLIMSILLEFYGFDTCENRWLETKSKERSC
ncbi:hypothetical protein INT48_005026 [Thamnidium elegans]|uniref:Uncharacterized protein n=1 Tax=Thamnidium elegans TaxID=101142 RepID=A0A8H7SS66_9FUNG|nr:hypothetical protein INT48_005026 [Thamnidium elegans]